ncbi:hypothetical protein CHH55_12970 [Niallia circulans]|jgi:hypothetical protein|uniref:Uncharacterized protein n=1 Tax=Niallia circulans TaxID=1397 RepID=A0A0J1ILD1_NIACI|nr:hypothetical protein [Niallia circulans]KLV26796.1 hypothetical protein ABW02_09645 [Niallia circulans]MCM2981534.1 hypothetical protein [Niallia circulans]MED5100026.1 hypothetical protein [Niallia circulans]NRG34471.1 hypothetical protein [Niallia circulans]PAD24083.1 hypothetical protein CHH62_18460 [Niallia circulans]
MAKSKARKKRDKVLREHGFDTTMRRGSWGSIVPITKITKTKKERMTRNEKKYKQNHSSRYDENGFYFLPMIFGFNILL